MENEIIDKLMGIAIDCGKNSVSEKDADYNSVFREEVKLLYDAAAEKDKTKSVGLIKESVEKLRSRQNKYFIGNKAHFREIDDFFLTMEGFGQFTMYL